MKTRAKIEFGDFQTPLPLARDILLNAAPCRLFLEALIFPDSKRPITVELLQRLNLSAIAGEAGLASRWRRLRRVDYSQRAEAPQSVFENSALDSSRRESAHFSISVPGDKSGLTSATIFKTRS